MKRGITSLFIFIVVLGFALRVNAGLQLLGQGSSSYGSYNLIYDTDLDITWYDYSNTFNTWQGQVDWADALSVTFGGSIYDNWRLPITFNDSCIYTNCTNSEMGHLFYTELGNKGVPEPGWGLLNTGTFQNLLDNLYWSGTVYPYPDRAWYFNFGNGYQVSEDKTVNMFALAVMDGLPSLDSDADGVPDTDDNCPNTHNPAQTNSDGDIIVVGGSDIRLDTDTAGTAGSVVARTSADENGHVYVVWQDSRDGSPDIYFNTSANNGTSWQSNDMRLSTDTPGIANSVNPQIRSDESGYVYVAWQDLRNGLDDVYFNYSSDYGVSWLANDIRLDTNAAGASESYMLQMTADENGNVYAVWLDGRNGAGDIYFNSSNDHGATWQQNDIRVNTTHWSATGPKISTDGNGHVYVIWMDQRNGSYDIYFNYSSDYGATWQAGDMRIDNAPTGAYSQNAEISADAQGHVYVTWQDSRNGSQDVYFNYSSDYGATWQTIDTRIDTDIAGAANSTSIRISNDESGHVYIVWDDYRNSKHDIYFNSSDDSGTTWQAVDIRLDTDTAGANSVDHRISNDENGHVYVVWYDYRNGRTDIYFNYSSDHGYTWEVSDMRLDTTAPGASYSYRPWISSNQIGDVYVVWDDQRNGQLDIYFNHISAGDPFGDACDNCPNDLNADQLDTDTDGQGDVCDTCPYDPQNDVDGDGVCGDIDNCPAINNPGQENSDSDTLGDACDACPNDSLNDADGDGVCGDVDICEGYDDNADADGDGIPDGCDNCPAVANPGQENADFDTSGDACDICPLDNPDDTDNDGVCDSDDLCQGYDDAIDTDSDGLPNGCDACPLDDQNDIDGDGICGDVDNCPTVANADQTDSDAAAPVTWNGEYDANTSTGRLPQEDTPPWTKNILLVDTTPIANLTVEAVETSTLDNLTDMLNNRAEWGSVSSPCAQCHNPHSSQNLPPLISRSDYYPVSYTMSDSSLDNAAGTTVEARLLNKASGAGSGLGISINDGTYNVSLVITFDQIYLFFAAPEGTNIYDTNSQLSARHLMDTADRFHTYTLTLQGDTARALVDGNEVITHTVPSFVSTTEKLIRFGYHSHVNGSGAEWDYVKYYGGIVPVSDGAGDACDNCELDPLKTDPGLCGCGVADTDNDNDGIADCNDTDDDNDGISDIDEITCGSDPLNDLSTCEVCDGVDNDLNDGIDEDFDLDGDGYTTCQNDCDDGNAAVNPGVVEGPFGDATCSDGIDNDCDGTMDATEAGCELPVADAGDDQSASQNTTVVLDGSGSYDPDGRALTFQWTFVSRPIGSTATLSDPTAVEPEFYIDVAGDYELSLVVNNGLIDSAADTVIVSTNNSAPIADAGRDQSVSGSRVFLDGRGSYDPDGDLITYRWSFVSKPAGSTTVLEKETAVTASFALDAAEDYVIELIVNDGTVDSAPDYLTVSTVNVAPIADAGEDQSVPLGSTVVLDGTGSYDPEGTRLTYSWAITSKPQGSSAGFGTKSGSSNAPRPSFVADKAGTYYVRLTVYDAGRLRGVDLVVISTINVRPVARIKEDYREPLLVGGQVNLDGTMSYDADGDLITYSWSFVSVPAGSTAAFDPDANSAHVSITVDMEGDYVISLVVSDGTHQSKPYNISLSVPQNLPPVAIAGPDQTAKVGDTVTLDSSKSYDRGGQIVLYRWVLQTPVGSHAVLSNATVSSPTFTVDEPGIYIARLSVFDGELWNVVSNKVENDMARVVISTINSAPIADAGPHQAARADNGYRVYLNGARSYDPDGSALTYRWNITTRPYGSAATLTSYSYVRPGIVLDRDGVYVFSLKVYDGQLWSQVSTTMVTRNVNTPPNADAGRDMHGYIGSRIKLNGSRSYDPDGDPITYYWMFASKPQGSKAYIFGKNSAYATFRIDIPGTYTVRLVVSDGQRSDSDIVVISTVNSRPRANAGPDQAANISDVVTLDGSGSTDADGDALSYRWSITSKPEGSNAELSDPFAANPTFTVDMDGDYVVYLVVEDGNLISGPDSVIITTQFAAPVADAGADQGVNTGDTVVLDGSGSSDADGDSLTYQWTMTSKPDGSTAVLSDPTAVSPEFVADLAGTYVVTLTVNDGRFSSEPDSVTIDTDADNDGIEDTIDNCINTPNAGQEDVDVDGSGDACDECASDPDKTTSGVCGCGAADVDDDGDGYYGCTDDCDDGNAAINPGAEEICDGVDNNCSGAVDEGLTFDQDGDGYSTPDSCTGTKDDCDDGSAAVNPGGDDSVCNGLDDDCDGSVDEEYVPEATSCGIGACAATGVTSCVAGAVEDSCTEGTPAADDSVCNGIDNDCDGSVDEEYAPTPTTCGIGECSDNTGQLECQSGTIVDTCDPLAGSSSEICDGLDNDCDGGLDEGFDQDSDGVADCFDNCPAHYDPSQQDIDGDLAGDICDICPADDTNQCDPDKTAATIIGAGGGTVASPDGSATIIIPPGALTDDTTISITETGKSYEVTGNQGNGFAFFGLTFEPEGLSFAVPVTVIFSWPDADDDGIIDGTISPPVQEKNIIITKDNVAITGRCDSVPVDPNTGLGCDKNANTFTFQVSGFSLFEVVYFDLQGPVTSNTAADPVPVAMDLPVSLTATIDDSLTGMATIASAEYKVNSGSYVEMNSQDGNFDAVTEVVTATVPAFSESGVYTICVHGKDHFGNVTGPDDCIFLPVYDPNGGFVTGGGWFNSPAGAYYADPLLTGKANFGFVSKYKKGATVPVGETEFQFKVADLNFHSNTYEWLVVSGVKAQYKGTGTINGQGVYNFILTGLDADINSKDVFTVDRFRIRIWSEDEGGTEMAVYDNGLDADLFSDESMNSATSEISGGSIVIHSDKGK